MTPHIILWLYSRCVLCLAALREIFRMFDKDDDGRITAQEMKDTLRAMGDNLTDDEIEEAYAALDIDGM